MTLEWAERVVALRDHELAYWGRLDHAVDPLRGHPRCQMLLEGRRQPTGCESG